MSEQFENLSPKNIHYFDSKTGLTRGQYLAMAKAINKSRIIRENWDDWVIELGDDGDRSNTEAIATWISRQVDIFTDAEKKDRAKALQHRFKATMKKWLDGYLENGFEIY
ncbi:MAG: hypothetical protein ABFS08_12290 [Pseudomonadota bacterium]